MSHTIELSGPFEFDGKTLVVESLTPTFIVPMLRWYPKIDFNVLPDPDEPLPVTNARFVWTRRLSADGAHIYEYQP